MQVASARQPGVRWKGQLRNSGQSLATPYARKTWSGYCRALEANLGQMQRGSASSVVTVKRCWPRRGAPNLGRSERLERVQAVVETTDDAPQGSFYISISKTFNAHPKDAGVTRRRASNANAHD